VRGATSEKLFARLKEFVNLASADSKKWIPLALVGSIALAALDTLGVAAMVPLMALFTTGNTSSGVVGFLGRLLGTHDAMSLTIAFASLVSLVFIMKSACTIPFRWWLIGRTTRVSADAATELMRRYVLSSYADHRARKLPEIYRNVGESTAQAASVLLGVVSLGSDGLVLAAILVVLLIASPWVTVFAVAFFAVLVMASQRAMRSAQVRFGEELADLGLQTWQQVMPAFDGFKEARLTASGMSFVNRYQQIRRRSADVQRTLSVLSELPKYVLEIGFVLAIVGIAGILFSTGASGQALSVLAIFAAASLRALPTMNRITVTIAGIRSGQAGLRIVSEAIVELDGAGRHEESRKPDIEFRGDIELQDVKFRYRDSDEFVIDGLSLVVPENRSIAFVGSSGAGKSTLLDLLLGLLTPTSGSITCGGLQISNDLASWYDRLGVVPQDVYLMDASLVQNIAFGLPAEKIDRDRAAEVIRLAELEAFVGSLEFGMDTPVGERGTRLSGGQRQRLGLARALYRRPSVLVLDEATSALDNQTEHEIAETLGSLSGSMTIVIVAHRLSTVRNVDRLVYLDRGRIAGAGTFEEVERAVPDFAKLVRLGELR